MHEEGEGMNNIVAAPFKKEHLGTLAGDIEKLIYEYANRISVAEAIGVLEIVKAHLLETQHDHHAD
jgi:hypothetical protein